VIILDNCPCWEPFHSPVCQWYCRPDGYPAYKKANIFCWPMEDSWHRSWLSAIMRRSTSWASAQIAALAEGLEHHSQRSMELPSTHRSLTLRWLIHRPSIDLRLYKSNKCAAQYTISAGVVIQAATFLRMAPNPQGDLTSRKRKTMAASHRSVLISA
jgi:hypothetical protein